jgi:pimeloyl-ACP methyl ester carboxylesterase
METSNTVLRPLVLLVHGAWHGAWCWAALQSELDQHGIASLAIDLPGHGASTLPLSDMHGDAQHVADIALKIARPVVLVGHSYGGGVIGEAAHILRNSTTAPVQHLLYLTAFCLDAGVLLRFHQKKLYSMPQFCPDPMAPAVAPWYSTAQKLTMRSMAVAPPV